MRAFRSLDEVPADFGPSVVTIGNFDGVHAGHREILRRVAALGSEHELVPAVLTFDPHPARVLAPERAPRLITTIAQRLRRIEKAGVHAALLLPFSKELACLSPEEFATNVLAGTLRARIVLVGEDFRFGYRQAGDISSLRALGERLGFRVHSAGAILWRGERVSSTAIRKLIQAGRVDRACRMLGEPFALEGPIVKGHGIGSKKTVPTMNLAPENELLPAAGVYLSRLRELTGEGVGGREWNSITNVGNRPTFDGSEATYETYLLDDFDGVTPERVEVRFLRYIRDERKFASSEALRAQILKDVATAQRWHRHLGRFRP